MLNIPENIISIGSIAALVFALFKAFVQTRTFVDWLDRKVLNGTPRKIPESEVSLINRYMESEEIKVNKILSKQPDLKFQKFQNCPEIVNAIDHKIAEKFHEDQLSRGLPDDPHAFVFPKLDLEIFQDGENQELNTYAIGRYSELRSLPKILKHRLLVLGANNLVISPTGNEFIMHRRGDVAETQSNMLHGFGGGYMPYWIGGDKSNDVRRDDCKSLRFTAMRELNEESGLLSLDHVPNFVCALEERHKRNSEGKFGYLTFFFITRINYRYQQTYKGDPREGSKKSIPINKANLNSMIIHKKIDNIEVHPQMRAMLLIWVLAGCPGLHFLRRAWISNPLTRRALKKSLQ
jgi:hypothetical protein